MMIRKGEKLGEKNGNLKYTENDSFIIDLFLYSGEVPFCFNHLLRQKFALLLIH